jgi:hypothetical protein
MADDRKMMGTEFEDPEVFDARTGGQNGLPLSVILGDLVDQ